MIAGLRLAAALLGAGLVLQVHSEYLFFNEAAALPVARAPGGAAALAAIAAMVPWYAAGALLLGALFTAFRVGRWPGAMLAGALFGWALEAGVVPVAYEALPLSLLWPAVGWHMPVTVGTGLLLLPAALRRGWRAGCAASLALGLAWGGWTTWTWAEGPRLTPAEFTAFALLTGSALTLGMALFLPLAPALRAVPRALCWSVGLAACALVLLTGLATHPAGLALLAGLIGISLWALVRSARAGSEPDPLPPASPWRAAPLLLAAPVAAATYAALDAADHALITEDAILFLLFSATCVFFAAIWRAFTRS